MLEHFLLIIILMLILFTTIRIAIAKSLFAITIISGAFSIACVLFYTLMGALDVALTEAAVGTGISTVLTLLTVFITRSFDHDTSNINYSSKFYKYILIIVTILAIIICSISFAFAPIFSSISNPSINNVYSSYIDSYRIYKVPNLITVILGNFRGYDTLGETFVVFTATVAVLGLLQQFSKRKRNKDV